MDDVAGSPTYDMSFRGEAARGRSARKPLTSRRKDSMKKPSLVVMPSLAFFG